MPSILSYPSFLKSLLGLTSQEIKDYCHRNQVFREFYHRPGFWADLIELKRGFRVKSATPEDYDCLK